MAVYVVTWDLNKEKPNYSAARQAFIAQLEQFSQTKDQGLDSVRFIDTPWTPSQVRDHLKQKMDNNDRLFIAEVIRGRNDGWLSTAVWDWINART